MPSGVQPAEHNLTCSLASSSLSWWGLFGKLEGRLRGLGWLLVLSCTPLTMRDAWS